jgi:hypothetical protein
MLTKRQHINRKIEKSADYTIQEAGPQAHVTHGQLASMPTLVTFFPLI